MLMGLHVHRLDSNGHGYIHVPSYAVTDRFSTLPNPTVTNFRQFSQELYFFSLVRDLPARQGHDKILKSRVIPGQPGLAGGVEGSNPT